MPLSSRSVKEQRNASYIMRISAVGRIHFNCCHRKLVFRQPSQKKAHDDDVVDDHVVGWPRSLTRRMQVEYQHPPRRLQRVISSSAVLSHFLSSGSLPSPPPLLRSSAEAAKLHSFESALHQRIRRAALHFITEVAILPSVYGANNVDVKKKQHAEWRRSINISIFSSTNSPLCPAGAPIPPNTGTGGGICPFFICCLILWLMQLMRQ